MVTRRIHQLIAVLSLFGSSLAAIGPVATLEISNTVISPDGSSRSSVVAGGTHPGPLITGKTGDRFQLNIVNHLTDDTMLRSTSIHWHGILQKGSAWADGPAGVSQCPISPGHSFQYQFDVNKQAGTYWYHSHLGTQYCDGLRGPLVIYDKNDPYKKSYDVDDESTVLTLGEWYQIPSGSLSGPALGNSTLINGKGRYINGPQADLTIINVERFRRYRIRLINIACDPNYEFSIDGHSLTIIEADGEYTEKHTVDRLRIFAGQRYSFILETNQPVDNYWIRAQPNSLFGWGSRGNTPPADPFAGGLHSAILRYKGARPEDPTTKALDSPRELIETNLHALIDSRAPGHLYTGGVDVQLNLVPDLDNATHFTINGASFLNATNLPVLLQILSGTVNANDLLPKGSVYNLKRGQIVELTIPNNAGARGGPHPFHLHGHSFSVVRSAGSDTTNYENPVRRDVVSIGDPTTQANSNVTIRFVADNAGPWILHCHIDFHLEAGLAVVFAEDAPNIKDKNSVPAAWDELCPIYNSLPPSATAVRPLQPNAKISFV